MTDETGGRRDEVGRQGTALPCCLQELLGLAPEEEQALLGEILARGWDQGCLIEDSAELRAPGLDPHSIDALLRQVAGRGSVHPAGEADEVSDAELPQVVPDQDLGLLVLTQRCDIVKPLAVEPLIEVALAQRSDDAELLAIARRGGSVCHIHLADLEDTDEGWLVDLRTRGHLPKHWLKGRVPAHLLSLGPARRRFAARVGDRNSRIPVPTEIVDGFQGPLRNWLYASARRREQCAHFSDFLLVPTPVETWALIAILGEGKDADAAMADFDALLGAIVNRVDPFPISSDLSEVLRPEDLSHADYLAAYKLDFRRVTFGSKAAAGMAQAEPALE